jgi:Beta-propeller repeat
MIKLLTTLLLICLCKIAVLSGHAQTPGYSWIKPANGTGGDAAKDVVISKDNHLYTCGNFSSPTLQLGTFNLTNAGNNDIYIAKYDTAGNIMWVKKYGAIGNDAVQSITTDSLNNIYITGSCEGTVSFGALNFSGGNYILKLTSLGNEVWIINPASNATVTDIAANPAGKTVICGYFNSGTVSIGGQSVIANAGNDGFVAAFDDNGAFSWYRQVYSTRKIGTSYNLQDKCITVTVAASGLIAIAGEFAGDDQLFFRNNTRTDSIIPNMVVDPQRGICPVAGFAACINITDGFLWAKDDISSLNSGRYWSTVHHIAVTPGNDVFVSASTLSRSSTTSFDNSIVVKYNSTGAKQWTAGPASQFLNYIAIGTRQPALAVSDNLIYLTEKELSNVSMYSSESRIHCFNNFGTLQWSSAYTGIATGPVSKSEITALVARRNVYAAGTLLASSFANLTTTYSGNNDGYLARLDYYTVPTPPLVLSSPLADQTICPGASVTLATGRSVSGGVQPYTYSWSPATALNNAGIFDPTATPTVTTAYVLTVTDGVGTVLRDTALITVRPPLAKPIVQLLPAIPPLFYDTLVCNSPETGLSYMWNNSPSDNGQRKLIFNSSSNAGTYFVRTTLPIPGCIATSDLFYYRMIKANAGRDTTVCAGQSLILGGTPPHFGTAGANLRYLWFSPQAGYAGSYVTNPYITITPTVTADYFMIVTDDLENYEIADTVKITVSSRPNLGADTLIYHKCYLETTNLLSLYNTTGLTAIWNTATPALAPPGNYQLIAIDTAGCADTAFANIKLEVATWTGATSSDWHTASNWNINRVPTPITHVIINSSTPNGCSISTANGTAASMQLRNGAVLNMSNGMTVVITGSCAALPPN